MLQEGGDHAAEPGKDELLFHYYTLACMLKALNGNENIFTADKLID